MTEDRGQITEARSQMMDVAIVTNIFHIKFSKEPKGWENNTEPFYR